MHVFHPVKGASRDDDIAFAEADGPGAGQGSSITEGRGQGGQSKNNHLIKQTFFQTERPRISK